MDDQTNAFDPAQTPTDPALSLSLPDQESRQWAMFCHLSGLAKYIPIPLSNVLAPLILWQIKKDQSLFVDDQGKEALNFQISITIYAILAALSICIFVGFVLLPVVGIFDLVFMVIAGIKANQGELYRYPLTIRFVK